MGVHPARELWHAIEPLNAVTYFAPECRDANTDLGLRGFWMGYFAARAAPMGAVSAGVVGATFFNFAPGRVARAIPDAWTYAAPDAVVERRSAAAAIALRRLVPDIDDVARAALPVLGRAVDAADAGGRPLFAANRDVAVPGDPVAALWQCATTLREHRGDGHVAALVSEGVSGLGAHVLFARTEGVPPELLLEGRGWSRGEWDAEAAVLAGVDAAAVRARVEARTDELALRPYTDAGVDVDGLLRVLRPAARAVADGGEIRFPNPMGLPRREEPGANPVE